MDGNPAEAMRELAVEAGFDVDHEAVDALAAHCQGSP